MKKMISLVSSFLLLTLSVFGGEPEWGPITSFDTITGTVTKAPIIVANEAGIAAVVWIQSGNAYTSVFTPERGTWDTPSLLGNADDVDICIDENGNITAVALLTATTNTVTSYTRLAGSTTFTPQSVYNPADPTLNLQDVGVACTTTDAQVLFTWVDVKVGAEQIQSKYRANGVLDPADPTTATTLPTGVNTPSLLSNPIPYMLPSGETHIVYFLEDGGSDLLYTNIYTPGTGWGTETLLGFPLPTPFFDFVMNSQGNGLIVAGTNSVTPLLSVRTGGSWSIPQSMNTGDINNPANLSITVDENNVGTVIWVDDPTGDVYVRSTSLFSVPADWDAGLSPVSISSTSSVVATDTSSNGNLVVGWLETSGSNPFYVLYREANASSFFSLKTIESSAVPGSFAVINTSLAFAAWTDFGATVVKVTQGVDRVESLSKALSKKRLIYQKGMYP